MSRIEHRTTFDVRARHRITYNVKVQDRMTFNVKKTVGNLTLLAAFDFEIAFSRTIRYNKKIWRDFYIW